MGKFISLGEYDKQYKYIWIYLVIRFFTRFIFDYKLVFEQIKLDILEIPHGTFIDLQFEFFGFFIISLILKAIKTLCKKKRINKSIIQEKYLIFNEIDISTKYGIDKEDYFLYVNIFLVVIMELLWGVFLTFQTEILDYWMFEMLFFEILNSKFLNTKIYKHHIISLIFILFSCSLINTISIILSFSYDTDDVKIIDNRNWLIPFEVIISLLLHLFQAYLFCNEKYYLEKRIISISDYMLCYGIFGIITSFICIIISTFFPCGDNSLPELSKFICNYQDDNENYHLDSYIIYFKELAKEYLGLKIFLILIYITLIYSSSFYCYVIFKKLNPIYHICMYRLNFLIIDILKFINDLANDTIEGIIITKNILDILILLFYLLGAIVYLEFIELNFCGLNFYLKKNIKERALSDTRISLDTVNSDICE